MVQRALHLQLRPGGELHRGAALQGGPRLFSVSPGLWVLLTTPGTLLSQHPGQPGKQISTDHNNIQEQQHQHKNINNNININININLILRSTGASWQRTESNGEKFLDVILSPGDKTRLELSSLISPGSSSAGEGEVCLQFLYKKYGECWCSV